MNWYGLYILFKKETHRFLKVATQTILAPIITVLLYLLVFSSVLAKHVEIYTGIDYISFLIPGLIMMSVIQNAFANSSSSLIQSKMNGSLVLLLLPPLSNFEFYFAYIAAATVRGLLVGLGVWVSIYWFIELPIYNIGIIFIFALLGSLILGTLGLIAGIWADKWDHIAAFQNFVILPMTFLSGVFYRIDSLPEFWEQVSYYNPFFYMIDGFRYGFLGIAEANIYTSLIIICCFTVVITAICLWLLHIGYKIRS